MSKPTFELSDLPFQALEAEPGCSCGAFVGATAGWNCGAGWPAFQAAISGRSTSSEVVPYFSLGSMYEFSRYSFQLTIRIAELPAAVAPVQLFARKLPLARSCGEVGLLRPPRRDSSQPGITVG